MHKIYIINLFFLFLCGKKIVNQFPCLDKLLFFSLSQDMYEVEINHIIGNYSKQRSFFFVVAKPHENTFYYVLPIFPCHFSKLRNTETYITLYSTLTKYNYVKTLFSFTLGIHLVSKVGIKNITKSS